MAHLESRFETCTNRGVYNPKTWNKNYCKTGTWQIDHIIPMAMRVYICDSDPGFLESWKLENLRPLRSKENTILGAKMQRINTKKNLEVNHVG